MNGTRVKQIATTKYQLMKTSAGIAMLKNKPKGLPLESIP